MRKRTFCHVHLTRTQISLRIRAVWSGSSLSAWRNFASLAIQNAPSEDSDQTARMRRLIGFFAERTCPTVRFLTSRIILLDVIFSALQVKTDYANNVDPDETALTSRLIRIYTVCPSVKIILTGIPVWNSERVQSQRRNSLLLKLRGEIVKQ